MTFVFRHLVTFAVAGLTVLSGGLLLPAWTFAGSPAGAGTKGVVELFTSQGCSSCPPADRLLETLARDPDLVAISFPVDYWDYIGWKDTLASPRFTARQKAYAAVRGDEHIYTPQVIVDGRTDVVGSDSAGVDQAISDNKGLRGALTVPLLLEDGDGVLHIRIGAAQGNDEKRRANVYVLRVEAKSVVEVNRGENKGQKLSYVNVVRAISQIGEWHGEAQTFDVPEIGGENEGYVVLLQEGSLDHPGTILAAAKGKGI